jgi:hypothetical protein
LACLKHSARAAAAALADCFCAAAAEIDNARSAGTSRANANRAFGVCIIASFFGYRHNARLECTTISGDHLAKDEESPLPQMRKIAPLRIEMLQPNTTKKAAVLFGFLMIWIRCKTRSVILLRELHVA